MRTDLRAKRDAEARRHAVELFANLNLPRIRCRHHAETEIDVSTDSGQIQIQ